jgi:hypothetical protein
VRGPRLDDGTHPGRLASRSRRRGRGAIHRRAEELGDALGLFREKRSRDRLDPFAHLRSTRDFHRALDRKRHLARGCKSRLGRAREATHDDVVQRARDVRARRARRFGRPEKNAPHQLAFGACLEKATTRKAFPQEHCGRIDVARTRGFVAVELLRRHVGDLAFDLSLVRRLEAHRGFGDAEVQKAGDAVGADHHVLRRHVAMDDVEGLSTLVFGLVGGVQSVENPAHDARGDRRGGDFGGLRFAERAPDARERFALDEVHHQEELAPLAHDVERLDDVGMVDSGSEPRLVQEHGDKIGILREVGMKALDGHRAREPPMTLRAPHVHAGHSAGGDLPADRVTANGFGCFAHRLT